MWLRRECIWKVLGLSIRFLVIRGSRGQCLGNARTFIFQNGSTYWSLKSMREMKLRWQLRHIAPSCAKATSVGSWRSRTSYASVGSSTAGAEFDGSQLVPLPPSASTPCFVVVKKLGRNSLSFGVEGLESVA